VLTLQLTAFCGDLSCGCRPRGAELSFNTGLDTGPAA
jgi:hypothetical protein